MFLLVLPDQGRSWPVTADPMVIGRGPACDVQLDDALVSRVHCKLWADDDGIRVEDLNSSNETVVNGVGVQSAVLQPGDKLGVGGIVLHVVCRADPTADSIRASNPDARTVDLAEALRDQARAMKSLAALPDDVATCRRLLHFNRRLSGASEHAELLHCLTETLDHEFEPDVSWLIRRSPRGRHLVYRMHGVEGAPLPDELELALRENQAMLIPRIVREEHGRRVETTLIAPVLHRNHDVAGAIITRLNTRRRVYDESDLAFLCAYAEILGPHWDYVGLFEQFHREIDTSRDTDSDSMGIVGKSPRLLHEMAVVQRFADTNLSVLLLGETGCGKELFARYIHERSRRSDGPFIVVDCPTIPEALFESEMFGHEAGAFTNASKRRAGRFELAHGGTIFLDEIGDLSLANQARILRAIETGKFYRVGGNTEIAVDVRFVAATNKIIPDLLSRREFRKDLYHRIAGIEIHLPPLRERLEDIPLLARNFAAQLSSGVEREITEAAVDKLVSWHWPGNVRELRNCIHRAVVLAGNGPIDHEHIKFDSTARNGLPSTIPAADAPIRTLAEVEDEYIRHVLRRCNNNMAEAAKALGISRATLYRKFH